MCVGGGRREGEGEGEEILLFVLLLWHIVRAVTTGQVLRSKQKLSKSVCHNEPVI